MYFKDDATGRSLTILANVLIPGSRYLLSVSVTLTNGDTLGPAYYEFVTNLPPQGGSCRVMLFDPEFLLPVTSGELVNVTTDPS